MLMGFPRQDVIVVCIMLTIDTGTWAIWPLLPDSNRCPNLGLLLVSVGLMEMESSCVLFGAIVNIMGSTVIATPLGSTMFTL